ncbi:MAG: hypothetical protein ABI572_08090 [Actinomycetota bacterium]
MLDRLVLRPGESPGAPHLGEDPDDWRAPSAPTDWRARTDGPARWLATLGVAFGFLLLVAPGVIASRQVADWRTGHRYRPAFAWALGALAAWVGVVTPLMLTEFRGAAAVLGVISLPPLLLWAARD